MIKIWPRYLHFFTTEQISHALEMCSHCTETDHYIEKTASCFQKITDRLYLEIITRTKKTAAIAPKVICLRGWPDFITFRGYICRTLCYKQYWFELVQSRFCYKEFVVEEEIHIMIKSKWHVHQNKFMISDKKGKK